MTEIATTTVEPTAEEVTAEQAVAASELTPPPAPPEIPEGADEQKKGVRAKLEQAEADRDALQARLDGFYDSVLTREAEALGLKPALVKAVGVSVADHVGEDGVIDYAALGGAMDAARAELGLPRKPQPNPIAGTTRQHDADDAPSWGSALQQHARRT